MAGLPEFRKPCWLRFAGLFIEARLGDGRNRDGLLHVLVVFHNPLDNGAGTFSESGTLVLLWHSVSPGKFRLSVTPPVI